MGSADYLRDHEWNVICHQCGFKKKSSEITKQWDGLLVCRECVDPRHPQDFVRGRRDRQTVPFSNPQSLTPTFASGDYYADQNSDIYIDDGGDVYVDQELN
jgi:hypothetical protein